MSDPNRTFAVLTGDLVKSSRLTSAQSKQAMAWLKEAGQDFQAVHADAVIGRVDTFRHDSWQMLVQRPEIAVRAAVFMRTALKMESDASTKIDTRVSIGVGRVESISKRRITDSRGAAFTRSGKGLDAMTGETLRLTSGMSDDPFWIALEQGVVPLLDCMVSDWTPTGARAVWGALQGWTQEESARQWPHPGAPDKSISRQAVGDSLIRSHWAVVDSALSWIEQGILQAIKLA